MAYKRKYRSFRKSRRGRYSRRYRRKMNFKTRVNRLIAKKAETKFYDIGLENQQLYHNTGISGGTYAAPLLFNPWQLIPLGTTRYSRIGDKVSPVGMKCRLWMGNKYDRPNIHYRVVVCVLPRMFKGAVVTAGSIDPGISAMSNGTMGNYLCLPWDTEKGIKVLYDRVIKNEAGFSYSTTTAGTNINGTGQGKECHKFLKFWIRRKRSRPVMWDQLDTTGNIINNPLAIYVIPYDSYGTLTTDNIASCALQTRLYFKDF